MMGEAPSEERLEQLTRLETAVSVLSDLIDQGVSLQDVLVVGTEPLLFACFSFDEELALKILHEAHGVNLNVVDNYGHTALHLAVTGRMLELAQALLTDDRTHGQLYRRNIDFPFLGKVEPGGRTALHCAVVANENEEMIALLSQDIKVRGIVDFDGNTPAELAQLSKAKRIADEAAAKDRYAASQRVSLQFESIHIFKSIWTLEECTNVRSAVYKYAETHGWNTKRHARYPTTDLASFSVVETDRWVRNSFRERVFPRILETYQIKGSLAFRDLFFVKYEAMDGEQSGLNLHRDGSVLSFNLLLNDPTEFDGGGTYFQHDDSTIPIDQGQVVVHSGKWLHAGVPVTRGVRLILVGFLNINS